MITVLVLVNNVISRRSTFKSRHFQRGALVRASNSQVYIRVSVNRENVNLFFNGVSERLGKYPSVPHWNHTSNLPKIIRSLVVIRRVIKFCSVQQTQNLDLFEMVCKKSYSSEITLINDGSLFKMEIHLTWKPPSFRALAP